LKFWGHFESIEQRRNGLRRIGWTTDMVRSPPVTSHVGQWCHKEWRRTSGERGHLGNGYAKVEWIATKIHVWRLFFTVAASCPPRGPKNVGFRILCGHTANLSLAAYSFGKVELLTKPVCQ
jgi:hypothetical protein